MNLEGGMRQKSRQLELAWKGRDEVPSVPRSDESPTAVQGTERPGADGLMERVLERRNMQTALRRVKKNRGSPGVDGMSVEELLPYLWEHWAEIKSSLLDGTYRPSPVKRQEIPKAVASTSSPASTSGQSKNGSLKIYDAVDSDSDGAVGTYAVIP